MLADALEASKAETDVCAGPCALMLNEASTARAGLSAQLKVDANCGAALLATASEIEAGHAVVGAGNSISSSDSDFREEACGRAVPTSDGVAEDFSALCALDSEVPLPTADYLEANGLAE